MKIQLSEATTKYGAQFGRSNDNLSGKVRLQKVSINSQGYDNKGAYWGIGAPLYVAQDENGKQFFLRARKRADAKNELLVYFPLITFYR